MLANIVKIYYNIYMNVSRSDIDKITNEFLNILTLNTGNRQLKQFRGIENTHRADYKGREILELLQNAVDALKTNEINNKVFIKLFGDDFYIYNMGEPFEYDGIYSLIFAHNSTKPKNKFIGNKGLGFRSILNWADDIKICSNNGLKVEYNADNTNSFYRNVLRNMPNYHEVYKDENVDEIIFPVLSYPKYIEDEINLDGYSTCINLHIKPTAINSVKRQLKQLDDSVLIFLPDINELIIDDDGEIRRYTKTVLSSSSSIETIELSNGDDTRILDIHKIGGEINEEKWEISIAMDNKIDTNKNYLHNYFRTKILMPIKWHIHATLDLNSERNDILSDNDKNSMLIQRLREFLFETAEQIAAQAKDYSVAESLIKDRDFNSSLDLFDEDIDFNQYYDRRLKNAHVLPTISGKMISMNEEPWLVEQTGLYDVLLENRSSVDGHELFDRLLSPDIPEKWEYYISSPEENCLFDCIERMRHSEPLKSNIIQRAEVAFLLFEEYFSRHSDSDIELPHLFVSDSSNQSTIAQDVYVGDREEIDDIPDFVVFKFMNPDQYEYVLKRADESEIHRRIRTAEDLAQSDFGSFYHLKTIDTRSILEDANDRIYKQQDETKLRSYFIKYINFVSSHIDELNDRDGIVLLARDNTVRPAATLYFGIEYGEEFCERILGGNDYLFVKSADYYQKEPSEMERILSGIVEHSPRLIDEESGRYYSQRFYKKVCKELDLVLDSEPKYFFKWFLDVFSNIRPDEIKMRKIGTYIYEEKYSELYRKIREKKVFKGDKSYDFDHILEHGSKIGENVSGLFGLELADYYSGLGIESTGSDIQKIVTLFKIADSYSKLDADIFCDILDSLPNFDTFGKISTNIYNSIVRDDVMEKKIKGNADLRERIDGIKVFTNHGYIESKYAVYANYKEPECFKNVANFIKIPKHSNQERVKTLFGVKLFDHNKVEIVNNPTINERIYSELKENICDLKTYVLAIRLNVSQDNRNKQQDERKVRDLEIIPTPQILVTYGDNEPQKLDEFDFIRDQNSLRFYIVLGEDKSFRDVVDNPEYCKTVHDIVSTAMDSDAEMDLIKDMAIYEPKYREKMYLDAEKDYDSLNDARERLGVVVESKNDYGETLEAFYPKNIALLEKMKNENYGKYVSSIYIEVENGSIRHEDYRYNIARYIAFDFEKDLNDEETTVLKTKEISDSEARDILKTHFNQLDYNIIDKQKIIDNTAKNCRNKLNGEYTSDTERMVLDEVLASAENNSLLYFEDQYNNIKTVIDEKIEKNRQKEERTREAIYNRERPTASMSLANVITPEYATKKRTVTIRTLSQKSITTDGFRKKNESNAEKGGAAEYEVRRKLEEEGFGDIRWYSAYSTNIKYAKEYLQASHDDSIGYDMSYISPDGSMRYVEVKSCNFNEKTASITMSSNEFEFASRHAEQYDLYLVKIEDDDKPAEIKVIESFINKDFNKSSENYKIDFTFDK